MGARDVARPKTRTVARNRSADRTVQRTRANADPCHSCHGVTAPSRSHRIRASAAEALRLVPLFDAASRTRPAVREAEAAAPRFAEELALSREAARSRVRSRRASCLG